MLLRRTVLIAGAAALSGCATLRPPVIASAGPPPMQAWAEVLRTRVDGVGRVDFRGLAADPAPLEAYVASIADAEPATDLPGRDGLIAFRINSYNALAMYDVIRSGIPERLSLLDRLSFFKLKKFVVRGREISLYDYETDVIRPMGEERVHFALNCMAVSCPRLPQTPFTAAGLDRELDSAARLFFSEPRNVTVDDATRTVFLSAIMDFYTEDFLKKAPSLIAYVNRYRAQPIPADYQVRFFPYDWTINIQPPRPNPAS